MLDSPIEKLIDAKDPFNFTKERDELFLKAMKDNFAHHYHNCLQYGRLCTLDGFTPDMFMDFEDVFYIPHLFVSVLKRRTLKSVPDEDVRMTLQSSGTGGEKSAIYLDEISLSRIRRIVWNIYEAYGMADKNIVANCLLFSYEYEHAQNVGTAFSDQLLSSLTQVAKTAYALKYSEETKDFYLDLDGVIKSLQEFARDEKPLRIIGFPAFLYEIWEECERRGLPPFKFGEKSFIITGGGWKNKADREIPRREFKEIMSGWLGMPAGNVRDLLGMVEHGVPYCECEAGNLHVPIYSRVVIRDPESLQSLPDGMPGLLHLYTPYLNSFPALSLLTTDLGTIHHNCECGRSAPYIKVLGRGGVKKHKGCALAALDYLK